MIRHILYIHIMKKLLCILVLGLLLIIGYQQYNFPNKESEAKLNLFFEDPIFPIRLNCKETNNETYIKFLMNLTDDPDEYFDYGYDYFELLADDGLLIRKSFDDILDNSKKIIYGDYVSMLDLYEIVSPKDDSLKLTLNVYKKGVFHLPFKVASHSQSIPIVGDNDTYTVYQQMKNIGVYEDFICSRKGIRAGCVHDVDAYKSGQVQNKLNASIITNMNSDGKQNELAIFLGGTHINNAFLYVSGGALLNSRYRHYYGSRMNILYPSEGKGCYSIIPRILIDSMRLNTYQVRTCNTKDSLISSVFAGERIREVDYTFCKTTN